MEAEYLCVHGVSISGECFDCDTLYGPIHRATERVPRLLHPVALEVEERRLPGIWRTIQRRDFDLDDHPDRSESVYEAMVETVQATTRALGPRRARLGAG